MTELEIPTPQKLDKAPELAVLVALDAVLRAAEFAVISVHPAMRDPDGKSHEDPSDSYWVASVFVTLAGQLHQAIGAYHAATVREHDRRSSGDDEISF